MQQPDHHWYRKSWLSWFLRPLSWLYCALALSRRQAYIRGWRQRHRLPVPVVVVGNITVGGTGKTPLVIYLVGMLRHQGYRPGVVSRGYGGQVRSQPRSVTATSAPSLVGDEPVLIARRAGCPVRVGTDRVSAARLLVEMDNCDLVIADDGLQHYPLERDVEIAVVDGVRRYGNGYCLPAGPLREPQSRLRAVDLVVATGPAKAGEYPMTLQLGPACQVQNPAQCQPVHAFAAAPVAAVAGIGHPERFFQALRDEGLDITARAFPDHHCFQAADFAFAGEQYPVLMTEKDGVKCATFATDQHWYVPVTATLPQSFLDDLTARLDNGCRRVGYATILAGQGMQENK